MCRCGLTGQETVLPAGAADFARSITAPLRICWAPRMRLIPRAGAGPLVRIRIRVSEGARRSSLEESMRSVMGCRLSVGECSFARSALQFASRRLGRRMGAVVFLGALTWRPLPAKRMQNAR